jgi:hypothetical protein
LKEEVGCSPQCRRNHEEKKEEGFGFLKQRKREKSKSIQANEKAKSFKRVARPRTSAHLFVLHQHQD